MSPDVIFRTITDTAAVQNLLLFLVPGFVAFKLDQQLRPQVVRSAMDAIIEIIAYSIVNDVLWSPWYSFATPGGFPRTFDAWAFTLFVVLVSPAVLTVAYGWLVNLLAANGVIPSPVAKPWDHFFSRVARNREFGIILTLRDGSRAAGVYRPPAFASSFPAEEQLLLAETWSISEEGGFERRIRDSVGLLIDKDDILLLEFYRWPDAMPREPHQGEGAKSE